MTTISARLAQIRRGDDAGFSLSEVVVTMALSLIIGTMTLGLLLAAYNVTGATDDESYGTADARVAIENVVALLRLADSPAAAGTGDHRFEWITPTETLFYANVNNRPADGGGPRTQPVMVWLALRGTDLVEQRFVYDTAGGGYPSAPTICRVIARRVIAPALFAPLDSSESSLGTLGTPQSSGTAQCQPRPAAVPQTDGAVNADLRDVRSVAIELQVTDRDGGRAHTFKSMATLA